MGKRVHAFPLRLPIELYGEAQALNFKHRLSSNLLFVEMIRFAYKNPSFLRFLNEEYPPDLSRGHFVFIRDGR